MEKEIPASFDATVRGIEREKEIKFKVSNDMNNAMEKEKTIHLSFNPNCKELEKPKDFNLKEKRGKDTILGDIIPTSDVKEFLRLLNKKLEFVSYPIHIYNEDTKEEVFPSDKVVAFDTIIQIIDKLSGFKDV